MDDNVYKEKGFDIEDVLEPSIPVEDGELAPLEVKMKTKPKRQSSEKKIDAAGISYYGERFTGYQRIDAVRDLIPAFKDLYYQRMVENKETRITHVLKEFNNIIAEEGRTFFPNTALVRSWKKKWDRDILEKRGMMLEDIKAEKHVQQVMKTRNSGNTGVVDYVAPSHETLEEGLQTLGGELLNDAMQMLRDDQMNEDIYESDELVKRKGYVVNVFGHVTKMVHGKAALMLKASQEKRENAGFLMDLMRQATAGKMSAEEIAALKQNYTAREVEPESETHVTRT